jgi:SWI/SNF-related matrix-associated actin-dependent regulator of chromatin subfamily A member 5
MDTLDLEHIFTAKIQDTPENQGRMEVMSHLANQIKQSASGQNSRGYLTPCSLTRLTNHYRV